MSVEIQAGKQLSGQFPNVTALVEGLKIEVPELTAGATTVDFIGCHYSEASGAYYYGGTACTFTGNYVTQFSNNPAWCVYDLLTNKRYGFGNYIDEDILDKGSFYEVGAYCDTYVRVSQSASGDDDIREKRAELDVVIDSDSKGLDLLNQLLLTFRGFLVWQDGKLKLRVDKPETPVQLFTMGNIVAGSFKVEYQDISKKPNAIGIQFLNERNNYQQDMIYVEDPELISLYGRNEKTISLFGIVRPTQAERMGRYLLKSSRYINRAIEFQASIDAIHCEAGDVINFQHDVPQWSKGGRIIDATVTHVYLDQEILLGTSGDYRIMCQLTGDTIETHWIDPAVSGYVRDVTTTGAFSKVPPKNGLWAIGQTTYVTKPFRIISMRRDKDDIITVNALEYNEAVYEDEDGVPWQENTWVWQDPDPPIPGHVQNLTAKIETDYYAGILVSWELPDDAKSYVGVDLYVRVFGCLVEKDW